MYNIDFDKLGEQLLPHVLRKTIQTSWIKVLLFPMRFINDAFLTNRTAKKLEATYNGGTMVLARALNNTFPTGGGNIWIDNSTSYLNHPGFDFYKVEGQAHPGYDYFASEGQPHPGYDYFPLEYQSQPHFKVMVPSAMSVTPGSEIEARIKALVNKYKLANKNYVIEAF